MSASQYSTSIEGCLLCHPVFASLALTGVLAELRVYILLVLLLARWNLCIYQLHPFDLTGTPRFVWVPSLPPRAMGLNISRVCIYGQCTYHYPQELLELNAHPWMTLEP